MADMPLALDPSAARLRSLVESVCTRFPRRSVWNPEQLDGSREWIAEELSAMGYDVRTQEFEAEYWIDADGRTARRAVANLCVELPGGDRADEIVVVGAHYDSRVGTGTQNGQMPEFGWDQMPPDDPRREFDHTPGANDNASGVAALLSLLESVRGQRFDRTLHAAFWVNEEYPFFRNAWSSGTRRDGKVFRAAGMGSYQHAEALARNKNERVVGAVALDCLGWYDDGRGHHTENFPLLSRLFIPRLFPASHDYAALLGDVSSRRWMRVFAQEFRGSSDVPLIVRAIPLVRTLNKGWSDDWSFWRFGVPAFCLTDTAYVRSRHYHRVSDTPDTLNYADFAKVVDGLRAALISACGMDRSW